MSRHEVLEHFRSAIPVIAPSMLKCDFGNLAQEVSLLESAGARILHLDVMDGHFVPNLTYGPVVIRSLRELTDLPLDAHLMISDPATYVDDFLRAGCNSITFHIEAADDPVPLLGHIRDRDALAGLSLNPGTPIEAIEAALPECDLVLIMSVEPGFGGQQFMPASLEKLGRLRQLAPPETLLAIDGGIGRATIGAAARAGADVFVVGSAIFDADDYRTAIEELRNLAGSHQASPSLEH